MVFWKIDCCKTMLKYMMNVVENNVQSFVMYGRLVTLQYNIISYVID